MIQSNNPIISIIPLGFQWETPDPFLFCVHHDDHFPPGNDDLGPEASLQGRNIGNDFTPKDGWRMYHGDTIPGFPVHPHRGFETVTIVLQGLVDHADSSGAAGRYGNGDVQWMTAGSGIQHSEMFPLLNKENENHCELFQLWINLPAAKKFVEPNYTMFWNEEIPVFETKDGKGRYTRITIIAGVMDGLKALPPPPDSWATDSGNNVGIWIIKMAPEAQWTIPVESELLNRTLYFYKGKELDICAQQVKPYHSIRLNASVETILQNGSTESYLLLLQGRPINEPVVQYGPFVMNSNQEIQQAMFDYQRTRFGGWPWPRPDQIHPPLKGRFARHSDGRVEEK
jgi:redox-sensitive bicupin YhaK (pirin superfamily)